MTATHRPFLAAYRHAAEPPHTNEPSAGGRRGQPPLSTTQLVVAPPYSEEGERNWHTPRHEDSAAPREAAQPRTKRPLASFLHNFEPPTPAAPTSNQPANPQWPALCLELLAGAANSYDQIIAQLDSRRRVGALTAIVGAGPQQGATTTAICLALRSAAHGLSTLLVDGDLEQAQLAALLGIRPAVPWLRLLREGAAVTDAVVTSTNVAVDVLLNESAETAHFDAWARFHAGNAAGQMRRRYQQTVIDLGHNLTSALEFASALAVDDVILICGPDSTLHDQERLYQATTARGQHVAAILRSA